MGTSNQPPIVSPGARGFELDNREGQINFTFKVILRPYISRIRMFAVNILLVRLLFVTILGPTPIFQGRRSQKNKIHVAQSYAGNFAHFFSAFRLFKDVKGN